jgi:hypothetical protein
MPNDLSSPHHMTERVEFEVDETTAAYLLGVSVGAAAARQSRELTLADAVRARAT